MSVDFGMLLLPKNEMTVPISGKGKQRLSVLVNRATNDVAN